MSGVNIRVEVKAKGFIIFYLLFCLLDVDTGLLSESANDIDRQFGSICPGSEFGVSISHRIDQHQHTQTPKSFGHQKVHDAIT